MYKNLMIVMKKEGVTQKQIAELLSVRTATVSEKINGKYSFYFDEAVKIKKVFFPYYEIEYLFHNKDNDIAV